MLVPFQPAMSSFDSSKGFKYRLWDRLWKKTRLGLSVSPFFIFLSVFKEDQLSPCFQWPLLDSIDRF